MRITPEDMLQMAVLMELHLAWPGHRDVNLPLLPEGWCWAPKTDENGQFFWLEIGSPSPDAPDDYDAADWVTLSMVAERASLISANLGLMEVM